jgi:glucokinase
VVNDFAAVARSLPLLEPKDTVQIGAGEAQAGGVMVAIGPGTGTGVASLVLDGAGEPLVVPGEGGHVDFAPVGDIEIAVLQYLRGRFERVSIERLLSGDGLLSLYRALCDIHGHGIALSTPEAVGKAAQAHSDPMAAEAMAVFFAVLGSVAGDLALTLGARGGVYIAGGIVPRYVELLRHSQFRSRFESKGRFSEHNKVIPSLVVTHPNPGLLGVACFSSNT